MTIIFFLRSADSQYLKIHFWRKKEEKSAQRTKIDFFVLTKRSFLTCFSRVLAIWKFLKLDCELFLHRRFSSLQILSWLQIFSWLQIILRSTIFINRSLFLIRTREQWSKMKIFDYLKWHYWVANSKNFVCCSKRFFLCKKMRDKYRKSNSTYCCLN
jgi:hypothetical protein